ncbi:MAG: hypothetical protein JW820_01915, partial [Spirochaetales bacterium]|nr:hypothetical protein [Spirochaetales bacterium]
MRQNLLEMVLLFAAFYLPGLVIGCGDLQAANESPGRFMAEALLAALPQLALLLYVLWLRETARQGQPDRRPDAVPDRRPPRRAPSPWQRFGLGRLRARDLPAGLLIFAGTAA